MSDFSQVQLQTLETLNNRISNQGNPAFVEAQPQLQVASKDQMDRFSFPAVVQNKITSRNTTLQSNDIISPLNSIASNQTIQTDILVNELQALKVGQTLQTRNINVNSNVIEHSAFQNMGIVENSDRLISEINKLTIQTKSSLLSLDKETIRSTQFSRGIGREARFVKNIAIRSRTSVSAALAFFTPVIRVIKPKMTIEEKQLSVLMGLHDIARFSGQELLAIRKGSRANNFESDVLKSLNRTIGQKIADTLQTIPILAPIIETTKFITKTANKLLTPLDTLFGTKKPKKPSKFSTGSDLAIKAGLDLNLQKSTFQFLGTIFPNIAQETKDILNRQLGVQENIQGTLEEILSALTGTSIKKRVNQRDIESLVFDPFLGKFISKAESLKLDEERNIKMFNARRRERGIFSRLFGVGKKEDLQAAKDAQGTTVNQQKQTHLKNLKIADAKGVEQDQKLVNSVRFVTQGVLFATLGPLGVILGDVIGRKAASKINSDTPIEDIPINFRKKTTPNPEVEKQQVQFSKVQSISDISPVVTLWQDTIINQLPIQTKLINTLVSSDNKVVKSQSQPQGELFKNKDQKPTVDSRLNAINMKNSANKSLIVLETDELQTLKAIQIAVSSNLELSKERNDLQSKSKDGLFSGLFSSFGTVMGVASAALSGLIGGAFSSGVGVLGTLLLNPATWGVLAATIISAFTVGNIKELANIISDTMDSSNSRISSAQRNIRNQKNREARLRIEFEKLQAINPDSDKTKLAGSILEQARLLTLDAQRQMFTPNSGRPTKFFNQAVLLKPVISKLKGKIKKDADTSLNTAKKDPDFFNFQTTPNNQGVIPGFTLQVPQVKPAISKAKDVGVISKITNKASQISNGFLDFISIPDAGAAEFTDTVTTKASDVLTSVSTNAAIQKAKIKAKAAEFTDTVTTKASDILTSVSTNAAIQKAKIKTKAAEFTDIVTTKASDVLTSVSTNDAIQKVNIKAKAAEFTDIVTTKASDILTKIAITKLSQQDIRTSAKEFVSSVINKATNIIDDVKSRSNSNKTLTPSKKSPVSFKTNNSKDTNRGLLATLISTGLFTSNFKANTSKFKKLSHVDQLRFIDQLRTLKSNMLDSGNPEIFDKIDIEIERLKNIVRNLGFGTSHAGRTILDITKAVQIGNKRFIKNFNNTQQVNTPSIKNQKLDNSSSTVSTNTIHLNDIKPNNTKVRSSKKQYGGKFKGLIARKAREHDIPELLLAGIIQAESDFRPNLTSRQGAQGLMQLMPPTAKELGVTDPFDPEQNVEGGSKYIGQLLHRYHGNVRTALAAYNWGMGNVDKIGLSHMPDETRMYVSKITNFMKDRSSNGVSISTATPSVRQVLSTKTARVSTQPTTTTQPVTAKQKESVGTNTSTPTASVATVATVAKDPFGSVVSKLDSLTKVITASISTTPQNNAPTVVVNDGGSGSGDITSNTFGPLDKLLELLFSTSPAAISDQAFSFSGMTTIA